MNLFKRIKEERQLHHLSRYWIFLTADGLVIIFMSAILIIFFSLLLGVLFGVIK